MSREESIVWVITALILLFFVVGPIVSHEIKEHKIRKHVQKGQKLRSKRLQVELEERQRKHDKRALEREYELWERSHGLEGVARKGKNVRE
jgi:hypothetical protein